jgi:integrase
MQLPNKCSISKISVTPTNWQTDRAPLKEPWKIDYRFYDNNLNQEKRFKKRVEKQFVTLKQRQNFVQNFIKDLHEKLENGFNPIREEYVQARAVVPESSIITFTGALYLAFDKMKVVPATKQDIKSMLNYVAPALETLSLHNLPIETVTRKHLKLLFEELARAKQNWSNNLYNHYRKYLHKLFADMVYDELLENNPVTYIKKMQAVTRIRTVLTIQERCLIDKHLKKNYPAFARFVNIFFHSGCRIIELLAVKKEDIELENFRFKVMVKKGSKGSHEDHRTIKKGEAFEHWQHLYNIAKPGQYVFGEGLQPQHRTAPIRRDQITRRWEEHIKKKLGIEADLYSLKHSNLTEISDEKGLEIASKQAGHTSIITTGKYYVQGQKQREHELLKNISNTFAATA